MKKRLNLFVKTVFARFEIKPDFSKKISVFICVYLWLIFLCFPAHAQTLAPGAPGKDAQWATAGKQAIGTSASLESKVWFTLAQGALTEVYYPDVTVANVHKLEFVVVNPKTKKVETEQDAKIKTVRMSGNQTKLPAWLGQIMQENWTEFDFSKPDQPLNALYFNQITVNEESKWAIIKSYIADPQSNTVMIRVRFGALDKNRQLYVYYDPSLANTGMHDTAWSEGGVMLAQDKNISSALAASVPLSEISSGFYGVSDGLEQLKSNGKIVTPYQRAENGNVTQIAKVNFERGNAVDFVLSFGKTPAEAMQTAKDSLKNGFDKRLTQYVGGWRDYIGTLPKVEAKYQAQFNMAAMVLKAQEDKSVRGANVASLTIPWGGGLTANEDVGGGYHLVWSRDLYQVFTAYLALGDTAAAGRALDFLFKIQQKPDGSFPQNSWLDGRNGWGGLQMDEVGYPLIMAYQLKRFDKETYEKHVKPAADFIVKNGPVTPQERWEEKGGYSPSTIAAEIAGLVCAAEIAKKNGDTASADLWLKTADDWTANIEKWTATTNGKHGDGNYYVRLTANGKPDAGEKVELNNNAGTFLENEIVDAGFLELVRLGIKSPDDPLIVKSLKVVDDVIRVKTPHGDGFYRYNNDGYGEMDDGRRWNWDGKYTGKGRLWALLAGERGQYELALARKTEELIDGVDVKSRNLSKSRLDAMLNFANEGLMIPEQIWDKRDTPKNIDKQFVPELKFGEGTGSATPLAWSMAQFIRLAVNLKAGRNLDTPDIVYERYVLGKKSEVSSQKTEKNNVDPGDVDINDINEVPKEFRIGIDNVPCFFGDFKNIPNNKCFATYTADSGNTTNPTIKGCQLMGFYISCNGGKEAHACFTYRGEYKTLEIAGDFTDWKPEKFDVKRNKNNEISAPCLTFSKTARVEYKLIVDGKWINDPLNPNKIDNGVGGENSFFTMPDYKATSWDKELTFSPRFRQEEFEIDSKIFGKKIIKTYIPESKEALPVLYLQDGTDYKNRALAVNQQINLVKGKKIKPFIMVFLDPKDRMKEYWANDGYAKFVATEVVPAIDAKYKTIKTRDGRGILGASLGGITSVHAAVKYPEIFGRIGGQSSSWWIDDERVVKELETLDAKRDSFVFYFDTGTLEGADDDKKAVGILRKKGYSVIYQEAETGHNWTSWRDRLADAFVALWTN